jgi:hypothetical protein
MKSLLPRHIRRVDWQGKKLKPRAKDVYWDGRFAKSHPNNYGYDEMNLATVRAMLARATAALSGLAERLDADGTGVVAELEADALNDAWESLDDITNHFPRVECWVLYNTYEWHDGHMSPVQPFYGFFDLDVALVVAEMWQQHYGKSAQWYVTRGGASMNMVIDPAFTDLERLRPSR